MPSTSGRTDRLKVKFKKVKMNKVKRKIKPGSITPFEIYNTKVSVKYL